MHPFDMLVSFPAGANSVAVRLDKIDRIMPNGTGGAEIILYGGKTAYASESVADAVRRVTRANKAAEKAFLEQMRAMRVM